MNKIVAFRMLTLSGYFGLLALIFCWHMLIKPLPPELISITLLMQVGPLMFPLRGLLHGKTYTHAWAIYLALFYFVIGVWYAAAETTLLFGIFMCVFSLDFFIGCVFYARFAARAERAAHSAEG